MNTYFNPQATAPQFPGMPGGALAGAHASQQQGDYRQMMGLQKLLMAYEQKRQEEELMQGRPVRDAQRAFQTSEHNVGRTLNQARLNNPEFAPAMVGGQMGAAQVQQAQGQEALGTVGGKIQNTNIDNQLNMIAGHLQKLRMMPSPLLAQDGYQQFLKNAPEAVKQIMPKVYSPEAVEKQFAVLADTIKQRQTMSVTNANNASAEQIGRGNNDATRYSADVGAESRIEVARLRQHATSANTKQNFQQYLTQYAQKRAAGQNTPADDQMAIMVEQMMSNNARLAGIDPVIYKQWVLSGMEPSKAPQPGARPAVPSAIPQPNTGGAASEINKQNIEAQGEAYQPDVYEYRYNPQSKKFEKRKR